MGLFSFRGAKGTKSDVPENVVASSENVTELAQKFIDATSQPCIALKTARRHTGVFDSKFGGMPYLPPGFDYPYNENPRYQRQPLKLLAQLNFATLPALPYFPASGILQFYVANQSDDDIYGADFDNLAAQRGFRVVYHANVQDETKLQQPPPLASGDDGFFPFDGEFALQAELSTVFMSPQDAQFERVLESIFDSPLPAREMIRLTDLIETELTRTNRWAGHRIGGYPFFMQYDPREPVDGNPTYTCMLLQVDSENDGPDGISWGDSGVANFFINTQALQNRDFSDVMFTWDCA